MKPLSFRRHVAAPIDRVFATASDFANAPQFMTEIVRVRVLTEGPVRVGTRFEATRRSGKREAAQTLEVAELDPPNRFALAAEGCGFRMRSEHLFSASAGGTDVEMRFVAVPLTLPARILDFLLAPFMKGMMTKACTKDLDDLAAYFERR